MAWCSSIVLTFGLAVEAAAQGSGTSPGVGGWATYEWKSAAKVDVPVLVQQPGAGGAAATWSVDREASAPRPIFVTYSVIRGDAKSYVLQIVTRPTADGTPLSVTQVTVDRASGKALKSVIKDKKGVSPHAGERPPAAPPGRPPGELRGGHGARRALHRREGAAP